LHHNFRQVLRPGETFSPREQVLFWKWGLFMRLSAKKTIPAALMSTLFLFGTGAGLSQAPPEEAKQTQTDSQITVPEGTLISISLTEYLNTKSSQVNDRFYAETVYPVWIQQRQVIPRGSMIRGTVTEVVRPGKVKGKGKLALRIDDILLPNGVNRPLVAVFEGLHGPGEEKLERKTESVEGGGNGGADVGTVANPAATGAIIGAVTGGGKGAGIGAGVGAAAGLATVLFSRGSDLVLYPGTRFDLTLRQPLQFSFGEINFTDSELNKTTRENTQPQERQRNTQPRYNQRGIGGIGWPLLAPMR
jgi:hypothetical protein